MNNCCKFISIFLFLVNFSLFSNISFAAIKIMPLGDSLTEGGYNTKGTDGEWKWHLGPGYRKELYKLLTINGYDVEFVGSVTDKPSYFLQTNHEGHSGWLVSQLVENVNSWFEQNSPEYVLLMIGTNDVVKNKDLEHISSRYFLLLDKIFASNPCSVVFLASPIATNSPKWNLKIKKIGTQLKETADLFSKQGYEVHYVDMFKNSGIIPDVDLTDGVHPTRLGYKKLGRRWFKVIKKYLKP